MKEQLHSQNSRQLQEKRGGGAIGTDLAFSSAVELAAAIRGRQISASEVLEGHLAQIERHNPSLNAIVVLDIERARVRAREADEALARGENWGLLHGVPFTLKDAHSTAGMRTTIGFPPLADYVPPEDSTVTARLRRAGGVLVGKTNVPMLLADYQSRNPIFGRTNNPWNLERTPGGSSGGAAAALASGMTPFEIGTDLSGSIRLPAHFCGVCGMKPTENRVPITGFFPDPEGTPRSIRVMLSIGPMARTIEDLLLIYKIIAGADAHDAEVQSSSATDEAARFDLETLRIAIAPTFPGLPVAPDIRHGVEDFGLQLETADAIVEDAPLPKLDFREDLSRAGELIGMMVGAFQPEAGEPPTTLVKYFEALHRRDQSITAWERFFEDWDALLCPASMITAFPHCLPGTPLRIDETEIDYRMVSAHGALFNYTGHPAIVLPYKLDRDGLPIGLQLVGRRWNDARLLAIATALAPVAGGFRRPPNF